MLRTKDGYNVEVGMWLNDITGSYEVTQILDNMIELREVMWKDPDECEQAWSDEYYLGDIRMLLHSEVEKINWL